MQVIVSCLWINTHSAKAGPHIHYISGIHWAIPCLCIVIGTGLIKVKDKVFAKVENSVVGK